jgi:hypothetical protein
LDDELADGFGVPALATPGPDEPPEQAVMDADSAMAIIPAASRGRLGRPGTLPASDFMTIPSPSQAGRFGYAAQVYGGGGFGLVSKSVSCSVAAGCVRT